MLLWMLYIVYIPNVPLISQPYGLSHICNALYCTLVAHLQWFNQLLNQYLLYLPPHCDIVVCWPVSTILLHLWVKSAWLCRPIPCKPSIEFPKFLLRITSLTLVHDCNRKYFGGPGDPCLLGTTPVTHLDRCCTVSQCKIKLTVWQLNGVLQARKKLIIHNFFMSMHRVISKACGVRWNFLQCNFALLVD